ncbi:glutathione S-transferase [Rhodococcoides trifolii]|uniref:Glutathione S-transferase n=1 Tax=Rhodococcoides trifolii TaxID=908250 RepID=A0A917D2D0_9NOCA|nr:DUF952 domain-containing protein [Rhodococcus trifolii]GGG08454.1 glutathione S-transferase [Rhodococcus trifolii]
MTDTSAPHAALVHICTLSDWLACKGTGEHRPPSLDEHGFVHLSTPAQVHLPANRIFAGRRDLVLLRLDPSRLGSPVKWEPGVPTDPGGMLFPHLYGPLPASAVTAVVDYRPDESGVFSAAATN